MHLADRLQRFPLGYNIKVELYCVKVFIPTLKDYRDHIVKLDHFQPYQWPANIGRYKNIHQCRMDSIYQK